MKEYEAVVKLLSASGVRNEELALKLCMYIQNKELNIMKDNYYNLQDIIRIKK